ncbi:MAG TPA: methyltransferase [Bacillota bacterium]|nr:methyltransferase [Bacillota bacterium]HOH10399.1 methyltransferase [Bacillota bacterium]HOY89912.1 methyltransferase [Bacillota bacterium]HPI01827.1 methyltransferase [Bacillota bacterium]HPM63113.1 methyltransferase [Bacillota bacterium]
MQEHYYSRRPEVASSPETTSYKYIGRTFTFTTDAGVFSKGKVDRGTDLLLEALQGVSCESFLDMGCGYGPVGVCYKAAHPETAVFMGDINERACELAEKNSSQNGVSTSVRQTDGFQAFEGIKFNCIAMNPPIRAGKEVLRRLMSEAKVALTGGGRLYIVIRTRQGASSMKDYLDGLFGNCEDVERGSGYRVLMSRKLLPEK